MAFNRRIMRGTLSEVLGEATLSTDRILRVLGIHRTAAIQLQGISKEARAALTAYSQGVNAFFAHRKQALSPEFQIFGLDPRKEAAAGTYWEPVDSLAWSLMMALDLGGNWGNEVARLTSLQALDTQALWQLFPPYPGEAPAATDPVFQATSSFRSADGRHRCKAARQAGDAPPVRKARAPGYDQHRPSFGAPAPAATPKHWD